MSPDPSPNQDCDLRAVSANCYNRGVFAVSLWTVPPARTIKVGDAGNSDRYRFMATRQFSVQYLRVEFWRLWRNLRVS